LPPSWWWSAGAPDIKEYCSAEIDAGVAVRELIVVAAKKVKNLGKDHTWQQLRGIDFKISIDY
jgi:hypothetical protein